MMEHNALERPDGRIITFYSYKGGAGRSMALVNAGWCLASAGFRVLLLDWDLEAPSLHRFLHPFLADPELKSTDGLIEFMIEFASAAVIGVSDRASSESDWFYYYAELSSWAIQVQQDFATNHGVAGSLHLVPAGRQGPHYSARVNTFSWNRFFSDLGGGIFLEAVKMDLRRHFDYILIDSHTGISDTAGICTVQMADDLVTCFTLNRQGVVGSSAIARSVIQLRSGSSSAIRVWPVPSRIDDAEKQAKDRMLTQAMHAFALLTDHISEQDIIRYWGEVAVPYQPFYAYEEILPAIADSPHQNGTILRSTEYLLEWITSGTFRRMPVVPDHVRRRQRAAFLPHEWREDISLADGFHRAFIASARNPDQYAAERELDRLQRRVREVGRAA